MWASSIRNALALDLIEELRPVLADRFVLSMVNKKIVQRGDFLKKENGAVLMKDDARRRFLTEWQNRKKETLTHPYLQEKVEWGMVPYVQAACEIPAGRFGCISTIFVEVRREFAGIDYI